MLHHPQIGDHFKIITFEKNENPENIMVVYTKLDKQCRFIQQGGQPFVDFYWLMNRERFKPTHNLIKQAVHKRLQVARVKGEDPTQAFQLKVNDLKELGTKIAHPHLLVKAEKSGSKCQIESFFPDEKAAGQWIQVNSLFSESKKTFTPPFRKLLAVTIRGLEPETGEQVERKFVARSSR